MAADVRVDGGAFGPLLRAERDAADRAAVLRRAVRAAGFAAALADLRPVFPPARAAVFDLAPVFDLAAVLDVRAGRLEAVALEAERFAVFGARLAVFLLADVRVRAVRLPAVGFLVVRLATLPPRGHAENW